MSKMKVLIAGGGIGGLATALSLLRRGFAVEVYEQSGEMREIGAGIQISPNGNRALDHLGVFDALRELSCDADGKEIRLWNTGKAWTLFDLGAEAMRRYGYPYMTVHRPDLLRVLGDAVRAIDPDAIRLNARACGMSQTDRKVMLSLADGRAVEGDLLVGADGVHSLIRPALHGHDEVEFRGMVAWRAQIPMPDLPARLVRNKAINWIGPGGHLVHYPIQGGRVMNFVGTLEGASWSGAPWTRPGTRDECHAAFTGWHDDVHLMIDRAPALSQWALCGRPLLPRWTVGRATLLGDACHVTLPFLGQGAVSSIEDAIVLGRCLQRDADPCAALQRYEAVRKPHTYRMVRGSAENTARFHNPALATVETAQPFIDREWQAKAISDRYDWLFNYDAEHVEI